MEKETRKPKLFGIAMYATSYSYSINPNVTSYFSRIPDNYFPFMVVSNYILYSET